MLNAAIAHRKLSTSSGRLPAPKARPEVTQLIPMAGRSGKLSPVRSSSKGEQSCPAQAKQKVAQDAQGYLRPLNLVRSPLSFDRSTALIPARATAARRSDDLQSSSACHTSHPSVLDSRRWVTLQDIRWAVHRQFHPQQPGHTLGRLRVLVHSSFHVVAAAWLPIVWEKRQ